MDKCGKSLSVKPRTAIIFLVVASFLLIAKAGFLIYNDYKHNLRLKLVENDLHAFWERFNRVETPEVIVDDEPEATQSLEMRRLWGNQERAEKEHRQEVVRLINEQREVVNEQEGETYPLLELEAHPLLEQSARKAFENIAETKRFEHQDMTKLLTRGKPFDRVGENLAAENAVSPTRTVYDWYLSESHKEIMLGDWEFIGVASGWIESLDLMREDKPPQDCYVTVAHFGE